MPVHAVFGQGPSAPIPLDKAMRGHQRRYLAIAQAGTSFLLAIVMPPLSLGIGICK